MDRVNLLIAATTADADECKRYDTALRGWHVHTPRNRAGRGFLIGKLCWTPRALSLPARVRWDIRVDLKQGIDEHTTERDYPSEVMGW